MTNNPAKADDSHAVLSKRAEQDEEQPGDKPSETVGAQTQPAKDKTEDAPRESD